MSTIVRAVLVVSALLPTAGQAEIEPPISFRDHRHCIAALSRAYDQLDQIAPDVAAARGSVAAFGARLKPEVSSGSQSAGQELVGAMESYIASLSLVCEALAHGN